MSTKQTALTLAKKIVKQGARVYTEENAKALTAKQRQESVDLKQKHKSRRDEIRLLLAVVPANVRDASKLLEMATFACDVKGDDPSIPQLAEAVRERQAFIDLQSEERDLSKAIRQAESGMNSRRYRVCEYVNGPIPMSLVLASGDTWDDVCSALRKEQERLMQRSQQAARRS